MKVAVTYHHEFGVSGEPALRERIIPSYEALQPVIRHKKIPVYTPKVTPQIFKLAQQVHGPAYIQKVKQTPFYENAALSAASVLLGAELLAEKRHKAVFSYTGCAGHHAGKSRFWGFCYLNDVAITIHQLQKKGIKRFLVLDIDPHFGDGTREFFQHDPHVIHINFFEGNHDVIDPRYHNYDYGLNPGRDEEFIETLHRALKPDFDFELMIVIFGHDSHYLDYGGFQLWDSTYPLVTRQIKKYAADRPLLWVLSGGSEVGVAKTVIPEVVSALADD